MNTVITKTGKLLAFALLLNGGDVVAQEQAAREADLRVLKDTNAGYSAVSLAIHRLGKRVGEPGVANALATQAETAASEGIRISAFRELHKWWEKHPGEAAGRMKTIESAARDPYGRMRQRAAMALRLVPGEAAVDEILAILDREFAMPKEKRGLMGLTGHGVPMAYCADSVILACIEGLERRRRPLDPAVLERYFKAAKGETKYVLANLLYEQGGKPEIEIMIEGVDKTSCVRLKIRLIHDLAKAKDPRALEVLRRAALDDTHITSEEDPKDPETVYPVRVNAKLAIEAIEGVPKDKP